MGLCLSSSSKNLRLFEFNATWSFSGAPWSSNTACTNARLTSTCAAPVARAGETCTPKNKCLRKNTITNKNLSITNTYILKLLLHCDSSRINFKTLTFTNFRGLSIIPIVTISPSPLKIIFKPNNFSIYTP